MHRESIVEALLGTALVFNTVFEMPESDPLFSRYSVPVWCL